MRFIFQKNHPMRNGNKSNNNKNDKTCSSDDSTVVTSSICESEVECHPLKDLSSQNDSQDDNDNSVVRFSATVQVLGIPANSACSAQVCWYDPKDFGGFKKSAHSQALETALNPSKGEEQYRTILQRVFEKCCEATEPQDADQDTNQDPTCLSLKEQTLFKRLITKSSSRCGLERTVLEAMKLNVTGRRRRLVQMAVHMAENNQGDSAALAKTLQELSWPSNCLAREMGIAYATMEV